MRIENTNIYNSFMAIRGIRNSYDSWDDCDSVGIGVFYGIKWSSYNHCQIGEKDSKLMQSLVKAGSSHRKFLRQIFVSVDMTLPIFLWSEMDTYRVATVRNSCSTMHTLARRILTKDDFEYEPDPVVLGVLNINIKEYQNEKDDDAKNQLFLRLKNSLPSGFLQKATMTFNYETLLNMYLQRRSHRLPQWGIICGWIVNLPLMNLVLGVSNV